MIPPEYQKDHKMCFQHGDDRPLKIGMKWA